MEKPKAVFTDVEQEQVLEHAKSLYQATAQLHEWVKKGVLAEEMKGTFPSLMEHHFIEIAKAMHYDSHLIKEREERYAELRKANVTIRELKEKLARNQAPDSIPHQLRLYRDTVRDWWREHGFTHISDVTYAENGCMNVTFSFMLDMRHRRQCKGKTKAQELDVYYKELQAKGYEFDREEIYSLVHTPRNVALLKTLLKERFPSIEIHQVHNWVSGHDENVFVIDKLQTVIYDLRDILAEEKETVKEEG